MEYDDDDPIENSDDWDYDPDNNDDDYLKDDDEEVDEITFDPCPECGCDPCDCKEPPMD